MEKKYQCYPPDEGLTKDELEKGYYALYCDVTCSNCGKHQSVAQIGGFGGPCIQCGECVDGNKCK